MVTRRFLVHTQPSRILILLLWPRRRNFLLQSLTNSRFQLRWQHQLKILRDYQCQSWKGKQLPKEQQTWATLGIQSAGTCAGTDRSRRRVVSHHRRCGMIGLPSNSSPPASAGGGQLCRPWSSERAPQSVLWQWALWAYKPLRKRVRGATWMSAISSAQIAGVSWSVLTSSSSRCLKSALACGLQIVLQNGHRKGWRKWKQIEKADHKFIFGGSFISVQ